MERSTTLLSWARSAVKRFISATDDKLLCDPYLGTGKDLYTAGRSPNNCAPSTFTVLLAIIGAAQAVRHTMRYLLCFACNGGDAVNADVIVDDLLRREKGMWFGTADCLGGVLGGGTSDFPGGKKCWGCGQQVFGG